jgi:hypothetical protein
MTLSIPSRLAFSVLASIGALAVGCASPPPEEEAAATTESPLKTTAHQQISIAECEAAGISRSFCERVGAEAFNVDSQEWNNLEAHAMPTLQQSQCDAAAAVQGRLRRRGAEIRAILAKHTITYGDGDALASSLGRALHTIQDNCAHEGMTNPQHSWYSNRGWCLSDGEDPDEKQAALDCAARESVAVLKAFADAARAAGYHPETLGVSAALGTVDPDRDQVCSFLHEWSQFDGFDRRWDNAVTLPAFRDTFIAAFTTGAAVADACTGLPVAAGHSPIAIKNPRPRASVSYPLCFTTEVYCVGE